MLRAITLTLIFSSFGTAGLAQGLSANELTTVNELNPIACLAAIDDLPSAEYSVGSQVCFGDIFDYCLSLSGTAEASECLEITNGHIRSYYPSFLQYDFDKTGLNPLIQSTNDRAMIQIADTVTDPSANCEATEDDPKILCQSIEMHVAASLMFMVTRSFGIDPTYPVGTSP